VYFLERLFCDSFICVVTVILFNVVNACAS